MKRIAVRGNFSGEKERYFHRIYAPEGTDFMKKVWKEFLIILMVNRCAIKIFAIAIGNEKRVEAVGMANN